MKKFPAIIVLLLAGAGLFFIFKSQKNSTSVNPPAGIPQAENSSKNVPVQSVVVMVPASSTTENSSPNFQNNSAAGPTASISSLVSPQVQNLPPQVILDNARVVMHNYNSAFGENPVGDNSEITAALTGKNPKQANFITDESGLRVNDKGELIDAWGTPFFFHQLSGQVMEIRSAGEDRKMWTRDDLTTQ